MPDIAMCSNKTCPSRNSCYRFRAVPSEHQQSYMAFEPQGKSCCVDFMPIRGRPVAVNEKPRPEGICEDCPGECCPCNPHTQWMQEDRA